MISEADQLVMEKAASEASVTNFLRLGWPHMEPGTRYDHNWHMDAIGDHLQAVADGQLTRLLINVPPGTSKSSICGVYFPAWLWGPGKKKHWRVLGASFEKSNATRDSDLNRRLVKSDWFQRRWPQQLTKDTEDWFENKKRGFRRATSIEGMTGKRAHCVIWDDPTNVEAANSETELKKAIRIFNETLPSRLVSPAKSAIIVIMQRLNPYDVSGHILANDFGYEHLMLPMEFEKKRRCKTSIGFKDPRKKEGELLHKARFPRKVVERDKKVMGTYAYSGQNQQRPTPREGGMFDKTDVKIMGAVPTGTKWVRGWDLAASKKSSSAYTAAVLMGRTPKGEYVIADVQRDRLSAAGVESLIEQISASDDETYGSVVGSIPQDPGAGGKAWAIALVKAAAGHTYKYSPETGDKVTRAEPLSAQVEAGNLYVIPGKWNQDFLDELNDFPGRYKDQVDAATRAFSELTTRKTATWTVGGKTYTK